MKKARALSTICTSLALAAPGLAEMPAPGCYAGLYSASDLAAQPTQGAAALRMWLFEESPGALAAILAARMADQARGASDGVAGRELLQYTFCEADEGDCFVECDGGSFDALAEPDGGVILRTGHLSVGDNDGCGGSSNLTQEGVEVDYRLAVAPDEVCADLSRTYPVPTEGCWGIDYSDMARGQGLLSLRLLVRRVEAERAFPLAEGVLAVTLPDGGRAAQGGMGGVRASLPVWCGARDGLCVTSAEDGAFRAVPEGGDLVLTTRGYSIWGQDGAVFDLAVEGVETRHRLRALPMDQCRGME